MNPTKFAGATHRPTTKNNKRNPHSKTTNVFNSGDLAQTPRQITRPVQVRVLVLALLAPKPSLHQTPTPTKTWLPLDPWLHRPHRPSHQRHLLDRSRQERLLEAKRRDCTEASEGSEPPTCWFDISNSITGESLALPTMPTKPTRKRSHMQIISGLGFCPFRRVYKVLCTFPIKGSSDEEEAMVLTVGLRISWRSIGHYKGTAAGKTQKRMIYLNGSLHWINDYGKRTISICAFDVEREVFQQLPSFTVGAPFLWDCDLGVLRGWLSLLVNISTSTIYGDISFWVMNDYGVKESWTK
ncbi:F-box protein At3g07870-like [Rosa chinensis]|uniref:F-box protein At3g07870-like n=1 Tax=Rosa chinensis TaxID=74649 RepID=UPI000D08A3BE|nr:F-box protein At3g07870-like [Rosa chinensis]